jgi:DNA-binding FadR family transcriptional regulator
LDKPARGPFTPVKQGNLAELVVSQIKNLIFSKGIDIGQRLLPERDLAEQLNISRSAVRESLRSLEDAGFIEIRRGRTTWALIHLSHLHPEPSRMRLMRPLSKLSD